MHLKYPGQIEPLSSSSDLFCCGPIIIMNSLFSMYKRVIEQLHPSSGLFGVSTLWVQGYSDLSCFIKSLHPCILHSWCCSFLVCLVFSISCVYGILVCLIGSHTVSGGGHAHQLSILCHLHQWLDFLILFWPQALQVLLTFSLWATPWIKGESWVPLYCYTTTIC